jgi:TRAP-type uncharacterized transport system substrate-binding protein
MQKSGKLDFLKIASLMMEAYISAFFRLMFSNRVATVSSLALVFSISIYIANNFATRVKIVSDQSGSSWSNLAQSLKKDITDYGLSYYIVPSSGTIENIRLLNDDSSGVNAAFLLPAAVDAQLTKGLMSLGSIDYEALWIVYRKGMGPISNLKDLSNFKVGVGPKESGRFVFTKRIFQLLDIDIGEHANFKQGSVSTQIESFFKQDIDAIIFIANPFDSVIKDLAGRSDVEFFSFDNSDAYLKNLPFLQAVDIPANSLNVGKMVPKNSLRSLSITTTVAVKKDTPANLQLALLLAMKEVTQKHENLFFAKKGELPAYLDQSLELSPIARDFYERGPPVLLKYTNFMIASFLTQFSGFFISAIALLPLFAWLGLPKFPDPIPWLHERLLYHSVRRLIDTYEANGQLSPSHLATLNVLKLQIFGSGGASMSARELLQVLEDRMRQSETEADYQK